MQSRCRRTARILAGGSFTSIGGQTRSHIARLDATTGLADSLDPNANNDVDSIAVQADGKILAGGQFQSIGGQARNRIARLDATTGLADSFDPNANSFVYSIAVQADGKILAGGNFTAIGGQDPRNFIARLDATTGAADSFDPNANGDVDAIAVQADGKILAGGSFTSIGGQTRNRIARLDATTGLADSFDPNANNEVFSIAVQADGKILAGGAFTSIGGQTRSLFARLSNDTAALQNLAVTQTTITWTRGGSSPQFTRVTFEYSNDNVSYVPLGTGTASGSNWAVTGLSLPTGQNIYIRARGYYRSGYLNGSESITESVRNAFNPVPTTPPVIIGGPNLSASATVGQPFVYQIAATNHPTSYGAPGLPPPLSIDTVLGIISGIPTGTGTFPIPISATNPYGTGSATLTLTVLPAPPSGLRIISSNSATGRTGQPFSFQVLIMGGTSAAQLSIGPLPPGLAADPVAGSISGTPPSDGNFSVDLTVTDGPATTNATLQLTFTSDFAIPIVTSPSTATLVPGQPFSCTITADAAATFSYIGLDGQTNGTLPPDLHFDASTHIISGIYTGGAIASSFHDSENPSNSAGGRPFSESIVTPDTINTIKIRPPLVAVIQDNANNVNGTGTAPLNFFQPVAGSRMTGSAGPVDIALPLTGSGTPGIESRSGGANGNYQVVFAFATPVMTWTPMVTSGSGSVFSSSISSDRKEISVNLTNVSNAQRITVALFDVHDDTSAAAYNVTVPMDVLVGDVTGNGVVNSSDVSLVKLQTGQPITASNSRADVNGNGTINSTDVSIVKSKSGSSLPPAPARLDRQ